MAEFPAQDPCEILKGCVQHSSGKPEFGVVTAFGLRGQLLCIGDGGRQGTPLLDFMEVVRFME